MSIPKFKIKVDVKLKEYMAKIEITDIFDEVLADLSGVSGRKELFVFKIFHKSFIEVKEEGTEAATD